MHFCSVVLHQRLRTWFVIKNRKKESLTYDTFAIIEYADILFGQKIIEQLGSQNLFLFIVNLSLYFLALSSKAESCGEGWQ